MREKVMYNGSNQQTGKFANANQLEVEKVYVVIGKSVKGGQEVYTLQGVPGAFPVNWFVEVTPETSSCSLGFGFSVPVKGQPFNGLRINLANGIAIQSLNVELIQKVDLIAENIYLVSSNQGNFIIQVRKA